MLNDLRYRLRALFHRHAAETELDDELRFHLEREIEKHVSRGVPLREARRRARLAFRPLDAVKDDCRQSWGIRQLDSLRQDAAYALRLIRKHPALSAIAATSLAIGIGLNTALFALVDATLLRRLPVDRPEQLVDVYVDNENGFAWSGSSYPDYLDLRRGTRVLADLVGHAPAMAAVTVGDRSRLLLGEAVTGNYFPMLGVRAAQGRALLPDDDRPGAARVVVISSALWSDAFGSDPRVVGRSLRIGGRPHAIVGVAPAGFAGMNAPVLTPSFWMPMAWIDDVRPVVMESNAPSPGSTRLERRGFRWMLLKGRLREGATAAAAAADLNSVMQALETEYPRSNRGYGATVVPTSDVSAHPLIEGYLRAGAVSLLVLIGLVLLIVCANVAGLLLARASARRREMGLRLAVGASRSRLLRQLLVESLTLSLLGVAAGVALAWGCLQALGAIRAPLLIPVVLDLGMNGRVLGLAVVVAVGAGVAAGLAPAWVSSRSSVLGELVGQGTVWSVGGRRWSLRQSLVTFQIAVSLVLLVVAGLLARNLLVASRSEPGFPAEAIAAVTVGLGLVGYGDDEAARFLERARERVRALPGVQAVARASRAPLSVNWTRVPVAPADRQGQEPSALTVEAVAVGAGYFDALRVPLLEGRSFDDVIDTSASPQVGIVNEALASRLWPDGQAVGRRLRLAGDGDGSGIEIVGVVGDYRVRFIQEPPTPYLHLAATQRSWNVSAPVLLARTDGDPGALAAAIQRELRGLDADVVFWEGLTLEDHVATQLLPAQLLAAMLGTAGLAAVGLAAIGLYGVIAFAVVQRTREIGIRVALGATRGDVLRLVVRQSALLFALGGAIGATLAFVAARGTAGVLFGIDATDKLAWGGAIVLLVAVVALAHAVPARRAVRVVPSVALRAE